MGERQLADAALAPMVRLISDIRLTLALLMLVYSIVEQRPVWTLFLFVSGVPCNLVFLLRWGRIGANTVLDWRFATFDAVASLLIAVEGYSKQSTSALGTSYLLISALVVGAALGSKSLYAWGVVTAVGLSTIYIQTAYISLVSFILLVLSLTVVSILGKRFSRQVEIVETLATDATEARIRQAAAEERIILARDLHDTVAKSAAGVRLLADILRNQTAGSIYSEQARELFLAADVLSAESRAVLDELRSAQTDDLRARLEQDAEVWARRADIEVFVTCFGPTVSASSELTWQAQRVLGELLSNVEKHSQANRVNVHIRGGSRLQLVVEDDGVGLPNIVLEDVSNLRSSGHYGLCGVWERVRAIDGTFELGKRTGGGTRIAIEFPVLSELVKA